MAQMSPGLVLTLLALSGVEGFCHNGGKFGADANKQGGCECPHPFFGASCENWRCVYGSCNPEPTPDHHQCIPSHKNERGKKELCSISCKGRSLDRVSVDRPCLCDGGATGVFCGEIEHCNRKGRLVEPPDGLAYCHCFQGFSGATCLLLDHSMCLNGGYLASNRSCVCPARFFGPQCEHYCTTGGNLATANFVHEGLEIEHTYCACHPGWSGTNCAGSKAEEMSGGGRSKLGTIAIAVITVIPLLIQCCLVAFLCLYIRQRRQAAHLQNLNSAAAMFSLPPIPRLQQHPGCEEPCPSYEEVVRGTQAVNAASDLNHPSTVMVDGPVI